MSDLTFDPGAAAGGDHVDSGEDGVLDPFADSFGVDLGQAMQGAVDRAVAPLLEAHVQREAQQGVDRAHGMWGEAGVDAGDYGQAMSDAREILAATVADEQALAGWVEALGTTDPNVLLGAIAEGCIVEAGARLVSQRELERPAKSYEETIARRAGGADQPGPRREGRTFASYDDVIAAHAGTRPPGAA